jgi:DNA-binding NarL/FixJ family response regulator
MNNRSFAQASTQPEIRIMIVEDHPLLIHGLRRIIEDEPDMTVVAEISDGGEAVLAALKLEPDVVLMDINLPNKNGLQATREIKTINGQDEIGVVVLTAYHDEEQRLHALCAGASAYYPKDIHPQTLLPAIRATAQGKYMIDDVVMSKIEALRWLTKALERETPDQEKTREFYAPLSSREMEMLAYITRGASNKEIAAELHISQQTVKNHISNMLRKMGVEDRTQAAVLALRRGWVRLEGPVRREPGATPSTADKEA